MSEPITRPYWWPKLFDAAECQRCREVYRDASGMSDEEIRTKYNDGCRYVQPWDYTPDAYAQYEPLADAFLATQAALRKLVEESIYAQWDVDINGQCYCPSCGKCGEPKHQPHCSLAAAIAEAERLLNESEAKDE